MGAHVQLPLAVNSQPEQKFNSLPLLGLNPATFGSPLHCFDHSAKPRAHGNDDDSVIIL
jgi:hypothetical protein